MGSKVNICETDVSFLHTGHCECINKKFISVPDCNIKNLHIFLTLDLCKTLTVWCGDSEELSPCNYSSPGRGRYKWREIFCWYTQTSSGLLRSGGSGQTADWSRTCQVTARPVQLGDRTLSVLSVLSVCTFMSLASSKLFSLQKGEEEGKSIRIWTKKFEINWNNWSRHTPHRHLEIETIFKK